jgi:hypothetical protein
MSIFTTYDIMWSFIYVHIHGAIAKSQNVPPRTPRLSFRRNEVTEESCSGQALRLAQDRLREGSLNKIELPGFLAEFILSFEHKISRFARNDKAKGSK